MYCRPREEKHGGKVSQPHSWPLASVLKSIKPLQHASHSQNEIIEQLRKLESRSADVESKDRPEEPDGELLRMRSAARGLWKRRVGVLVNSLACDAAAPS